MVRLHVSAIQSSARGLRAAPMARVDASSEPAGGSPASDGSPGGDRECPERPGERRRRDDARGEGVAADRRLRVDDAGAPAARAACDPHGGRTPRGSPDPADRVHGVRRERGDLLPDGLLQCGDLGPRPAPRDGSGDRPRGDRARRRHRARTRREHEAIAAVRTQLRVLLRGPVPRRRARHRLDRRHPGGGGRRVAQALRREQPGDAADVGERGGRRANASRGLPARLRGCRQDAHRRGP